jgi:hypothetical protein
VTVQLPAGSRVEARAASAQFTTAGQLGEVTFDSSQATIKVEAAAAARLTIADGDITVGRIRNALQNTGGTPGLSIHATTTVGDITARSL